MNELFAALYEGFHPLDLFYITGFSDEMFNSGIYVTIGLIMLLTSLGLESIYYYCLSSFGNFYKKVYWLIWLALIGLLNFCVAYYYSSSTMEYLGFEYGFTQYFSFSIVNVLWATIFSFTFSIILKLKSIKGSRTPF